MTGARRSSSSSHPSVPATVWAGKWDENPRRIGGTALMECGYSVPDGLKATRYASEGVSLKGSRAG